MNSQKTEKFIKGKKMKINNAKELKDAIRNGPYAWPGGYPIYFITSDGAALSFDAVKENFKLCLYETKNGNCGGWQVIGSDINWEDNNLYCEHTGKKISSAYCED